MKEKLAIFSVIILVIGILVYILIYSLSNKSQGNNETIKLRSDIKEGYTIDDMIGSLNKDNKKLKNYSEPLTDNSINEEENLKRIQELIRKNENIYNDKINTQDTLPAQRKQSKKKSVIKPTPKDTIKHSVKKPEPHRRGFLSARLVKEDETNAIKAFVHSTQTVMVGSTLKMQLAENCLTDDGQRVRKGTPVYGEVTAIDGERVIVKITSINIDNSILPFHKNVYSRDAMEGIYVPGNAKSETTKEAGSAAVQGANMNVTGGLDLSTQMAAGAVNSVVNAAKSVTSKNIRKVKVTIKTNYQILLMEDKK